MAESLEVVASVGGGGGEEGEYSRVQTCYRLVAATEGVAGEEEEGRGGGREGGRQRERVEGGTEKGIHVEKCSGE